VGAKRFVNAVDAADAVDALEEKLRNDCGGTESPPRLLRDEPMRDHTTFRVGGPADLFIAPNCPAQVAAAVRACRELDVPLLVLGNGSNLLVRDGGIRGAVLYMGPDIARCETKENLLVAQAGLPLPAASRAALQSGLDGLVFAEGIPGSIGGGACMNAGAYGGEMGQIVRCVDIVDERGMARTLTAAELGYGYRHSALLGRGWVVTRVVCALAPGDPAEMAERMRALAERRRAKQPLRQPSAGSTFKRPPGRFAAQLIDEAGLKGESAGGARVSPLHAGFIVNTGGATAADLLTLIQRVQEKVYAHSGVMLEPEVRIVGE